MNAKEIEIFEALLRTYELDTFDYNPAAVADFAEREARRLADNGIESGEEVEALNFMFFNAYDYADILEIREREADYDRWAAGRRQFDCFYQMI